MASSSVRKARAFVQLTVDENAAAVLLDEGLAMARPRPVPPLRGESLVDLLELAEEATQLLRSDASPWSETVTVTVVSSPSAVTVTVASPART